MRSQFQEDLNRFEKEVIESWYDAQGTKIGLSIQIDNEVQDEKSTTRDTKACDISGIQHDLINAYCCSVLEDRNTNNIPLCNGLDFHLKQIVNDDQSINDLGCRCHKGISNFVSPFKFENLEPTFYIFIGQFLFKPLTNPQNDIISVLDNIKLLSTNDPNLKGREKYVLPNPFVKENEYNNFLIKNDDRTPIAHIDYIEYIVFKEYVTRRFSQWIEKYYEEVDSFERARQGLRSILKRNSKRIKRPTEALRSFMAYENIESILYHLEFSKKVNSKRFNDVNDKVIDQLIQATETRRNQLGEQEIKELKAFSLLYKNAGIIDTVEFSKEGEILLNKLQDEKI